jgi:hypothetical protein
MQLSDAAAPPAIAAPRIVRCGEFIDALHLLRRGRLLVRVGDGTAGCTMVDGAPLWHSFDTLWRYGLIDEFDNPDGFAGVRYFRISARGRDFAARAWSAWRQRPWWQRLWLRLVH